MSGEDSISQHKSRELLGLVHLGLQTNSRVNTVVKKTIITGTIDNQIHESLNSQIGEPQDQSKVLIEAHPSLLENTPSMIPAYAQQTLTQYRFQQLYQNLHLSLGRIHLPKDITL
jgi:hypothetical protein